MVAPYPAIWSGTRSGLWLWSSYAMVGATRVILEADLENQPWPLFGQQFAGMVVTNYLWRPLWQDLLACLRPSGVLIYETFAVGNETVGKPSNPDFLLRTGELLDLCQGLQTVAYENGFCERPDRFVQRIVAVKPDVNDIAMPKRYLLER
jgi:hypothetical protein